MLFLKKTSGYKVENDALMNWILEKGSLQMSRKFHTWRIVSGLDMSKWSNWSDLHEIFQGWGETSWVFKWEYCAINWNLYIFRLSLKLSLLHPLPTKTFMYTECTDKGLEGRFVCVCVQACTFSEYLDSIALVHLNQMMNQNYLKMWPSTPPISNTVKIKGIDPWSS